MHRIHEVFFCIIQIFLIRPVINDSQEFQRYKLPIFHAAEISLMYIDFMIWQINMDSACEQNTAVHSLRSVRLRRFCPAFPQNVLYCAKWYSFLSPLMLFTLLIDTVVNQAHGSAVLTGQQGKFCFISLRFYEVIVWSNDFR